VSSRSLTRKLSVTGCTRWEDRKYKATFPVAPPPTHPRPPPVFPHATGSPPPVALAAGQRWRQQASRRPAPPGREPLGTGSLRGWGDCGQESGRAAGRQERRRSSVLGVPYTVNRVRSTMPANRPPNFLPNVRKCATAAAESTYRS
jgi:hypothetical protein